MDIEMEIADDGFLHPKANIRTDGDGNRLVIKARAALGKRVAPRIEFLGSNNTFILHEGAVIKAGHYRISGEGSKIEIGAGTTINGAYFLCDGGTTITLGHDCLLSYGIEFRTTDAHSILNRASGELLNPPADITIGDHCWIGKEVCILQGVTICDNVIVGTRALVTKSHDVPFSALAGVPARQVSENVEWHRRPPKREHLP